MTEIKYENKTDFVYFHILFYNVILMEQLQKTQLFESINSFINEIELSFDIPNLNDIKNYINLIENDNTLLQSFIQTTHDSILPLDDTINKIIFQNQKKANYTFMNDITLFNELLSFSLFSKDNKNTKKQLLKYIYEIYSSCSILLYFNDPDKLHSLFNKFYTSNTSLPNQTQDSDPPIQEITPIVIPQLSQNNLPNLPDIGNFQHLMSGFMNNKDILNIAQEITSQIDHEHFNPTDILSSLMSGNLNDGVLGNLMTKIQSTVDQKINNGTIDKDLLESHAKDIMEKMNLQPD